MSDTPRRLPPAMAGSSSGYSSSSSYPPAAPAAAPPPQQQHPACSACKHQRRKCAPGCPLAPYFPADKPGSFRNSHRLFGIKNILRFLARAGPEKRDDCMKSILYEADTRAASPVRGSYGVYQDLLQEFALAKAELDAVQEQLAKHRLAPDAPEFLAAVQPWMPPQPLLYMIPEEHQQPFYGGYVPPGAVKIDGNAAVRVKDDEDDEDDDEGRTLVGTPYGGDVPSSSSYRSSDPYTSPTSESSRIRFKVQF
ncbi:unnamed protein product [Alopecurus aequalis]